MAWVYCNPFRQVSLKADMQGGRKFHDWISVWTRKPVQFCHSETWVFRFATAVTFLYSVWYEPHKYFLYWQYPAGLHHCADVRHCPVPLSFQPVSARSLAGGAGKSAYLSVGVAGEGQYGQTDWPAAQIKKCRTGCITDILRKKQLFITNTEKEDAQVKRLVYFIIQINCYQKW